MEKKFYYEKRKNNKKNFLVLFCIVFCIICLTVSVFAFVQKQKQNLNHIKVFEINFTKNEKEVYFLSDKNLKNIYVTVIYEKNNIFLYKQFFYIKKLDKNKIYAIMIADGEQVIIEQKGVLFSNEKKFLGQK